MSASQTKAGQQPPRPARADDDDKDDGGAAAPNEVEQEKANDAATGLTTDDGSDEQQPAGEQVRFSFDLLANIKSAQLTNGLRHGDYQRYRSYCSRRLRRLRVGSHFTNPKRREDFKLRVLDEAAVTDVRHLAIALVQAERAWAYAMQLKNDMTAETQRKRCHLLKRLGKAASWAALLEKLCAARADTRTQLQAEAYAAWLSGSVLFERNAHDKALSNFLHAKDVYDKLGSIGGAAMQQLCEERVASLQDSIRFSKYMLRHKAGAKGGDDDEDDDIDAELLGGNQGNELLAAKLETLRQEKLAEQAQSLDTVEWQGKTVPVSNEKLRMSFVEANNLRAQLDKALGEQQQKPAADSSSSTAAPQSSSSESPNLQNLFQRLFASYDDALKVLRDSLLEPAMLEAHKGHLVALREFAQANRVQVQLVRNRTMVAQVVHTLAAQEARPQEFKNRKQSKPDEVTLLYEKIEGNLQELLEVAQANKNAGESRSLAAQLAAAKALRVFYLAESYRRLKKYMESFLLYGRALELAAEVDRAAAKVGEKERDEALGEAEVRVGEMKKQALSLRGQAHAHALLEEAEKKVAQAAAAPLAAASSGEKKAAAAASTPALPLTQRLDVWDSGDASQQHNLVDFPPSFQAAPAKPILFDLAFNAISYPDIRARVQAAQARRAGGAAPAATPAAAAAAAAPAKAAASASKAAPAAAKKPATPEPEEEEDEEDEEEEAHAAPAPAPAKKQPAAASVPKKIAPPGETKAARAERERREREEEEEERRAAEEAKKKAGGWGIGGLVGKMFGR